MYLNTSFSFPFLAYSFVKMEYGGFHVGEIIWHEWGQRGILWPARIFAASETEGFTIGYYDDERVDFVQAWPDELRHWNSYSPPTKKMNGRYKRSIEKARVETKRVGQQCIGKALRCLGIVDAKFQKIVNLFEPVAEGNRRGHRGTGVPYGDAKRPTSSRTRLTATYQDEKLCGESMNAQGLSTSATIKVESGAKTGPRFGTKNAKGKKTSHSAKSKKKSKRGISEISSGVKQDIEKMSTNIEKIRFLKETLGDLKKDLKNYQDETRSTQEKIVEIKIQVALMEYEESQKRSISYSAKSKKSRVR
eukprot:g3388.t1